VLDDEQRIPLLHQPVEHAHEQRHVIEVQSGRRLIENQERFFLALRHQALDELSRGEYATAVLLVLCGTFLFPCALLIGALGTSMKQILNPLLVIGTVVKLGRDYALIAGFAFLISLAESGLLAVIGTGLVQDALLLIPAQMLFRALGLLVRARGDELGYGGDSAYLVPVLGDQRPSIELQPAKDLIRSNRGV